jgi:hypothetical protein
MKKMAGIMFLVVGLSSVGFAQESSSAVSGRATDHRYAPYDMLLGFTGGMDIHWSGNAFGLNEGSFVFNGYAGANFDMYFLNWLSASSGLFLLEHMSLILKEDFSMNPSLSVTDVMQTPICLTIPVAVHVNVPRAEWLYLGAGVNFNIPLFNLLSTIPEARNADLPDTKGSFFMSVPVDIGIDMEKRNGSHRFVVRVIPHFLKADTLVTVGFMYQKNARIYRKR